MRWGFVGVVIGSIGGAGLLVAGIHPAFAAMECPKPAIMMAGADLNVAAHDPKAPLRIAWDRAVDMVPFTDPTTGKKGTQPYDYRPFLNNVNIAGGRYGLGTLLAGAGGIGGTVEWDGAQMVITPEDTLEPGTQYVVWVYKYISVDGVPCPRLGNRLFFKTAGEPPKDGNPIREVNLPSIWRGNSNGAQRLTGTIGGIHPKLNLVSLESKEYGPIQILVDEGAMIMHGEKVLARTDLMPGMAFQAEFFGERLTSMLIP